MNKKWLSVAIIILILVGVYFFTKNLREGVVYSPVTNPDDFSTKIDNPYFSLTPGKKFVFEAKKVEGIERIEVTVLTDTKTVMGIDTVVVKDQVFLNGDLIEDTLDWYAQDKAGNVWYFGEKTAEYGNGKLTTTAGSWEGGVDGALPGIVMKANPKVGDKYRQEYYAGEAEDMAEVLSVNEKVTVPYGSFTNCVKTFDYTPLNPSALEHKYYCKDVGLTTLEVDLEENERTELISVTPSGGKKTTVPKTPTPGTSTPTPTKTTTKPPITSQTVKITGEQARSIALERVPGTVTDIDIEEKFGKQVYVVEIDPTNGPQTDVIIDLETGEVLAVD